MGGLRRLPRAEQLRARLYRCDEPADLLPVIPVTPENVDDPMQVVPWEPDAIYAELTKAYFPELLPDREPRDCLPVIAQAERTGPNVTGDRDAGPVLSLEHISKAYQGTRALIDVSFDLSAGEIHSLIGENGAGKSTLMKILAGVVAPDGGRIVIQGQARQHLTPRSALELGVSTIYQDADIVSGLTVADNIFLGQEPTRGLSVIDTREQRRVASELIEDLGVMLDPDNLGELTPAERQLSMIVRALRFSPAVLVLDEPTSSLGQLETEHLLGLVRRLADKGLGIIYISHYLEEVLRVADRFTVLKDGRHVKTRPAEGSTPDDLVRLMVGRDASAFFVKETVETATWPCAPRVTWGPASLSRPRSRCGMARCWASAGSSEQATPSSWSSFRSRRPPRASRHRRPDRQASQSSRSRGGRAVPRHDQGDSGLLPDRPVRENLAVAWNELRGLIIKGERPRLRASWSDSVS